MPDATVSGLGQDASQIRNLVVGQGLRLVGISLGIGCLVPARRATAVNPLSALKAE